MKSEKSVKPAKPPKVTQAMVDRARAAMPWQHGAIRWTDRELRAFLKAVLTEPE